jgi:hypothetical protein
MMRENVRALGILAAIVAAGVASAGLAIAGALLIVWAWSS